MTVTVIATWLLAAALAMPTSKAPGETPEQVHARLETIAVALATAAKEASTGEGWTSTEMAAAVLVLWNEETRFDLRVHAGEKHPQWTQDQGKSRCLGQIQASALVPPDEWAALAGTGEEATLVCARATMRVLRAQGRRCGTYLGVRADRRRVSVTFSAYGSGGKCKADDRSWTRADRWIKVMAERPDRSPVKGYRRVLPREIPAAVRDHAEGLLDFLGPEWPKENRLKLGAVQTFMPDPRFKLIVEKHAGGKVGVSVLMKESM
jgi:hypothetical protein